MNNPSIPPDQKQEPEYGPDLTDEIAAEEEDDELELRNKEEDDDEEGVNELTAWDEPTEQAGYRVEPIEAEDENEFYAELAEEGVDTAEEELREVDELDAEQGEDEDEQ